MISCRPAKSRFSQVPIGFAYESWQLDIRQVLVGANSVPRCSGGFEAVTNPIALKRVHRNDCCLVAELISRGGLPKQLRIRILANGIASRFQLSVLNSSEDILNRSDNSIFKHIDAEF